MNDSIPTLPVSASSHTPKSGNEQVPDQKLVATQVPEPNRAKTLELHIVTASGVSVTLTGDRK